MAHSKIRITGAGLDGVSYLERIRKSLSLNPADYHDDSAVRISLSFYIKISFHDVSDYDVFIREGVTTTELFDALKTSWKRNPENVRYIDGMTHTDDEIDTTILLCELVTILKDLSLHRSDERTHYSLMSTSLTLGFGDQITQPHDNAVIPIVTTKVIPRYMHTVIQYEYPRVSGGIAASVCAGICIRSPPIGKCPPIMKTVNVEVLAFHYGLDAGQGPQLEETNATPKEEELKKINGFKRMTTLNKSSRVIKKPSKEGVGAALSRMLSWK
ncbi:matrix protein [Wheat yellow striate virus]|uniref:Matrix protein n=1 Tax=Wheat yellow striate virus TaxID=2152660 RepID=A0A2R4K2H7_9RHAB|nr:matrix protein [Wheat yellow striate virus]AVV48078.1 matrix protein [Wheat yellow striate virus]